MTRADVAARSIELRHLRYFVAVAEERHFTRAAARLHVSQPPLSAQIRQLEQRLDATLFVRARSGVALTDAGEALLEAAYTALAALDDGVGAVRAVTSGRGRVRVAVSATVPLGLALGAVAVLARRSPGVRADLTRADDGEDLLARGGADVAFLRAPLRDRLLWHAVVATERRMLLAAAGHRLARNGHASLAELTGDEVLEPPDGALGVGHRAERMEALLTRVAAGDAVAVVPEGLAPEPAAGVDALALVDAPRSEIVVAAPARGRGAASAAYIDAVCVTAHAPLRIAA